jgi:toxin-antitoxin system PIN domain toxin
MNFSNAPRYLLDVNVLVALLDEDHTHHQLVTEWFDTPSLQWAVCPFTEAGFLRYMTRPKIGGMSIEEATAMLARLGEEPGYRYQPTSANWHILCGPFFKRLFGHNQITEAYLLGLAISEGLILATFDKALLHLAAEHQCHLLLLTETSAQ